MSKEQTQTQSISLRFAIALSITLAPGTPDAPNRTIVGVGSIGQPQDGPSGKYVIWDQAAATVTYRILTA
jgi:hypothetical protein